MRHAQTHKLQLSGPTVHFLYCAFSDFCMKNQGLSKTVKRRKNWVVTKFNMENSGIFMTMKEIKALLCFLTTLYSCTFL